MVTSRECPAGRVVLTRRAPATRPDSERRTLGPPNRVTWHDVQVTAEQAGTISHRTDATARTVIECAADAIVAFGTDQTVMLWNPAAERMFGWTAGEVAGLEPPIIPEELK